MKKVDILNLLNLGFGQVTNHSLPVEHAYKVVKMRKALSNAFEAIQKDEEAIRKDAGIENPEEFDKELKTLREKAKPYIDKGAEIPSEIGGPLMEKEATLSRFLALRSEMLNEDIILEGVKAMPYEAWHELQKENAEKEFNGKKLDLLSGYVEDTLEGVLWEAPEEEN